MDIYDYLKLDHKHVDHLFKQFAESHDMDRKKQIVYMIAMELIAHAESEQKTFYKALENYEATHDEALHGKKEHADIEKKIQSIIKSPRFDASWRKKVEKLQELVQHHVSEEEGRIFRLAKSVLSKEEAWELKEQMHYLKKKILRGNTLRKMLEPLDAYRKNDQEFYTLTAAEKHWTVLAKKYSPVMKQVIPIDKRH